MNTVLEKRPADITRRQLVEQHQTAKTAAGRDKELARMKSEQEELVARAHDFTRLNRALPSELSAALHDLDGRIQKRSRLHDETWRALRTTLYATAPVEFQNFRKRVDGLRQRIMALPLRIVRKGGAERPLEVDDLSAWRPAALELLHRFGNGRVSDLMTETVTSEETAKGLDALWKTMISEFKKLRAVRRRRDEFGGPLETVGEVAFDGLAL